MVEPSSRTKRTDTPRVDRTYITRLTSKRSAPYSLPGTTKITVETERKEISDFLTSWEKEFSQLSGLAIALQKKILLQIIQTYRTQFTSAKTVQDLKSQLTKLTRVIRDDVFDEKGQEQLKKLSEFLTLRINLYNKSSK